MFSAIQISVNGFDKIILRDDETKTTAAVIPSCGAILHAFTVEHNNELLNVIDSYESSDDFDKNLTAKGFKGSKLSPFVCRLKNGRYHFGQTDHKIEKFYLGKHAIHGLIYDAAFTVTEISSNNDRATVSMQYAYRHTDKGYPFDYDCLVKYTLEKDSRLSVTTSLTNKTDGLIPVQDGWHPYFTFGGSIDELQLEFQSKAMIGFDEELIPTGKTIAYDEFNTLKNIGVTFLDNCFVLNFFECQPLCVVRDAKKKIQLEIYPGDSYPYLQIYTPPHRNSIAIENLSAAPDAFNNGIGLKILSPGEKVSFSTAYKIKSL